MSLKKKVLSVSLSSLMALGTVTAFAIPASAVGNGPIPGHGSIQTSILHTYESMVDYLKTQDAKQDAKPKDRGEPKKPADTRNDPAPKRD